MNYLRIRVHRWIREFITAALAQVAAQRYSYPYARRLNCFNKAGKHILFLVTLFASRKKVKLLVWLGRRQRIVFKSRGKCTRKIQCNATLNNVSRKWCYAISQTFREAFNVSLLYFLIIIKMLKVSFFFFLWKCQV